MNPYRVAYLSIVICGFAILSPKVMAQVGSSAELPPAHTAAVQPASGPPSPSPVLAYAPPTEKEKLRLFAFDAFGPYAFAKAALAGGFQQESNSPPEWGRIGSLRDAGSKQLRHPARDYHDALRIGGGSSRGRSILSLPVQGFLPARRPRADFHAYGTPRRRRPYCLFLPRTGFTVRRHDDSTRLVSRPLRCEGRISDGQLQPCGPSGWKSGSGIYLWRTAHAVQPHWPFQIAWWGCSAKSVNERNIARTLFRGGGLLAEERDPLASALGIEGGHVNRCAELFPVGSSAFCEFVSDQARLVRNGHKPHIFH